MSQEKPTKMAKLASVAVEAVVSQFSDMMKSISALPSPVKEICSCLVVYCILIPILFIPILVLFFVKLGLSAVFHLMYKDKFKLMESVDVVHTFDYPGSVDTINFFMYVNGTINIEELRRRIRKALYFKDRSGAKPYWKLSHASTQKFGFKCWEEKEDCIDFKHHIRFCPGASNPKRVYSEKELFAVTSETACELWDESKPKWEFLIIPQVRVPDRNNNVYSAILFRIAHEYGDGISLMQFQRHILFDPPTPNLVFDPVNPPLPKVPIHLQCLLTLQNLILGPSCIVKFLSFRRTNSTFAKGPMKGPKFVGRTKMEIPLEMTRRIRKSLGCSTSAIIHTAFCGAIRKLAKEKKLSIPNEQVCGMAQAILPYPNEHLHNHFIPLGSELPLGIDDTLERLKVTNKRVKEMLQPYNVQSVWYTYGSMGVFPTLLMKIGVGDVECLYAASNVPGIVGTVTFDGKPVEMVFGTPPSCIGMNFMIGLGCYDGKFIAGFMFNETTLVESAEDLEDFIREFEREIQFLDKKSKATT